MIFSDSAEKKVEIETKCPRCGKKISNNACDFCGYMLKKEEKNLIKKSEQVFNDNVNTQDEYSTSCPDCGMQLFPDEKWCSNCGRLIARKISCFCCGEDVDRDTDLCPKCGANIRQIDVSKSRNPKTRKFIMRDGSVVESNKWFLFGQCVFIMGVLLIFAAVIFLIIEGDTSCFIPGVVIMCIGMICSTYGSYKIHKGKIIVRNENDKIRKTNPNFRSEEDEEDIWDKLKNFSKKRKINTISSDSKSNMNQLSLYEELSNLKTLLDENILTQLEFDETKKSIIEKYQKNIKQ